MKAGVSNYISSLSKQDEKKIRAVLKTFNVNDAKRIIAFLEATLDSANFSSGHIGEDGLVSNEILVSEYVNNGLNKSDVVFAMDWLVKNTPIRRLQPFPRVNAGRYADKIEVVISFNDLDFAKQILSIIKSVRTTMVDKLSFSDKKLYIKGFCVPICKQESTRECWLLSVLFKNKKKRWATDDLVDEDLGGDATFDDYKTKKYYKLADNINKKIAMNTNIDDFLLFSTKNIEINQKYLK